MGDQGMDPCECIWGHELAMRRLLNLLRNSQSLCTDNECFIDNTTRNNQTTDNTLFLTVLLMAAFFLYFFRPRSQRQSEGPTKPTRINDNDFSGGPPTPPPSSA